MECRLEPNRCWLQKVEAWRLEDGRNIGVNPSGTKIAMLVGQNFTSADLRVYNFASGMLEKNVSTTNAGLIFSLSWGADPNRIIGFGGAAGGLARVFPKNASE